MQLRVQLENGITFTTQSTSDIHNSKLAYNSNPLQVLNLNWGYTLI